MNKYKVNQDKQGKLVTIRCILPWLEFFKIRTADPKLKKAKTEALIREIESKSRYVLPLLYLSRETEVVVKVERDQEFNKKFPSDLIQNHYPKFSLVLEIQVEKSVVDSSNKKEMQLFFGGYREIIGFVLETFSVAANLAYTGSLYIPTIKGSFIFMEIEGKVYDVELVIEGGIYQKILDLGDEIDWSNLGDLTLEEVWLWLRKFNDIFTGFCESQIGKVINALKHTTVTPLYDTGLVTHMVWLIVGLEALYLKEVPWEASKNFEIKKRVKSLLGSSKGIEILSDKRLGEIYSFRSNFFHGSLNLPAPTIPITYWLYKKNPKLERYYLNIEITVAILGLIIVSTLKKIILNKWAGLEFEVEYKPIGR